MMDRNTPTTPFLGPILNQGQRGAVLYAQGDDFKAEDALGLMEVFRQVPQEALERVEFLPMEQQRRSRWSVEKVLREELVNVSGAQSKETLLKCFGALASSEAEARRGIESLQTFWRELPEAENLLILGRPQYFAGFWTPEYTASFPGKIQECWELRDGLRQSLKRQPEAGGWRDHWFRLLVEYSGYPARFVLPWTWNCDAARPAIDNLFDRLTGRQLYQSSMPPPNRSEDRVAGEQDRLDYGLVFHNRVRLDGVTRRVTICAGVGVVGTWAAARVAVDPVFYQQLDGWSDVRPDHGPIEVAIRVRHPVPPASRLVGPHQLDLSLIDILNPERGAYVGQLALPAGKTIYPILGGRPPGPDDPSDQGLSTLPPLDLGRPLRAMREIFGTIGIRHNGANDEEETTIDPSAHFALLILDDRDRTVDNQKEERDAEGVRFEVARPSKTSEISTPRKITIRGARIKLGRGNTTLAAGPVLFTLIRDCLRYLSRESEKARHNSIPRPILLSGPVGSGRAFVVKLLNEAWSRLGGKRASRTTPFFASIRAGELAARGDGRLYNEVVKMLTSGLTDGFSSVWESIFLDELSDLTRAEQFALYRLLEEGYFGPGSWSDQPTQHRKLVMASTSLPLRALARPDAGQNAPYLLDLVDCFKEFVVPPLHERPTDALVLLAHLWIPSNEGESNEGEMRITLHALKRFLASPFEGDARRLASETVPTLKELGAGNDGVTITDDIMRRALTGRLDADTLDDSEVLVFCFGPTTSLKALMKNIKQSNAR